MFAVCKPREDIFYLNIPLVQVNVAGNAVSLENTPPKGSHSVLLTSVVLSDYHAMLAKNNPTDSVALTRC